MKRFEILRLTYRCPTCGRTFDETTPKDAKEAMDCSWIECGCGFKGEITNSGEE